MIFNQFVGKSSRRKVLDLRWSESRRARVRETSRSRDTMNLAGISSLSSFSYLTFFLPFLPFHFSSVLSLTCSLALSLSLPLFSFNSFILPLSPFFPFFKHPPYLSLFYGGSMRLIMKERGGRETFREGERKGRVENKKLKGGKENYWMGYLTLSS